MRIILVGGDKTAFYLARQLSAKKHNVTLIHHDAGRAKELARHANARIVLGEGTDRSVLEEAGARRADVVMALTPHDQDNLICCQMASRLYNVPRTIALANDPDNEEIFERLGVTVVFSATRVIVSLIEQQASFDEIIALMPLAEGKINVSDVHLDAESPAVGKPLQDLNLSNDTLIACIIRDGEPLIPRGHDRLQADDHVLVISHPETQDADLRLITGENDA
jgi:trk system potassium uptake protein TrkA